MIEATRPAMMWREHEFDDAGARAHCAARFHVVFFAGFTAPPASFDYKLVEYHIARLPVVASDDHCTAMSER